MQWKMPAEIVTLEIMDRVGWHCSADVECRTWQYPSSTAAVNPGATKTFNNFL